MSKGRIFSLFYLMLFSASLSACEGRRLEEAERTREIYYPDRTVAKDTEQPQLKLTVADKYLADDIMPDFVGPPLLAINFKDMSAGDVLPYYNPDVVLALAMLSSPKVPEYQSDYMDQPFNANFEWFKTTGAKQYGLVHKSYQVAEVSGYPASHLYLKDQEYHDFFIHCGLHAIPKQRFCTLGKELHIESETSGQSYVVNLTVKFDERALSDWKVIEIKLEEYFYERLEVLDDF